MLAFGLGSALMVAQSHEAPSGSGAPVVYAAEVDGIIHPVSAEYMIATMDRADRAGATLVVFTLRTPGALVDSTRDIITHMLASRTPVALFIGPSGARAASADPPLTRDGLEPLGSQFPCHSALFLQRRGAVRDTRALRQTRQSADWLTWRAQSP